MLEILFGMVYWGLTGTLACVGQHKLRERVNLDFFGLIIFIWTDGVRHRGEIWYLPFYNIYRGGKYTHESYSGSTAST